MKESMMDIVERMESVVPEYSYSSVNDFLRTDTAVREHLLGEMKGMKEQLFHVVQMSYEMQKDRLSDSAEKIWEELDGLVDRLENSPVAKMSGDKASCEECQKRIAERILEVVRKDRELVMETRDMKRTAYILYKDLLERGNEGRFIKNLSRIKDYAVSVNSLLDARESFIMGD